MLSSLRSRLIGAFALVICLSLLLAGTAFALLLSNYQTELALNRLSDLSLPLSYQLDALGRAGTSEGDVEANLKEQAQALSVRLLLLSADGQIIADTGATLVGQHVTLPPESRPGPGAARRPILATLVDTDGRRLHLVGTDASRPNRAMGGDRPAPGGRNTNYRVVVATPEAGIADGWRQLAPLISLAGVLSLLISAGAAVLLARSISQPIAALTRASERMARGDYEQQVPTGGHDEIGKLAESFNHMSREVARSHRTLKDFLVNVSHDLRTPLTSIQGFAQAMSDGTIQSPAEYLTAGQIIDEESARMRRIVEELLDLSRLESGQVELAREPVDLAGLLDAGARRARRLAEDKGASLDLELDLAAIPTILGDGNRLEQAFANLLDNAVKYTPSGHRIAVRARRVAPANGRGRGRVAVAIHNTGSHIPLAEQPRVFERFYQADQSRKSVGTGLGLAIVREIVLAHGGTVGVASDAGTGTTFTVELPVG